MSVFAKHVTTATLEIPDGVLHYEVRGQGPLVALIAAPMDATAFAPVADVLAADHTVLTTDPRGINRSVLRDPHQDSTPRLRAEDMSRLIDHLDAGPAAVFGSSGGAVTVLALAEAYPDQVHTVVAHEPPLFALMNDRAERIADQEAMIAAYLAGDRLDAGRRFLANVDTWVPEEIIQHLYGGEPDPQTAADEHFQYLHMVRGTTRFRPDVAALRAGRTRVVIGIGEHSTGQFCDRSSRVLARALGCAPTVFPGGHTGFLYDPQAFAARLREVIAAH
ncbi:alpha/beta hydrolase [Micromonospora mangrovi]|uniref:Alpha/beta hydrolase n=2 Tax=Micromonospora TaxID=1873 RepID=A0AAU7M0T4_9ACTN